MLSKQITKQIITKAENYLLNINPEFEMLIETKGPCNLHEITFSPFESLVRSIISQQLSNKAAKSIYKRFEKTVGIKGVTAENLIKFNPVYLRDAGISFSKSKCIIGIANEIITGKLDFNRISNLSDEQVIKKLVQYKGIGPWTSEMFLIFCLGRPDVISLTDSGIKRAVQQLFGLRERPSKTELVSISNSWKPYRSVACWFLWRSLD